MKDLTNFDRIFAPVIGKLEGSFLVGKLYLTGSMF